MAFNKITDTLNVHQSRAIRPVEPGTTLQALFDQDVNTLKTRHNEFIDELEATTDGNSGMDNIGMTPIDGVMTTPQQSLEFLKTRVDATQPTLNIASIVDFGAIGDGVADNYSVFKTVLESQKRIYISSGNYKIINVSAIEVLSDSVIYMDKDAVITLTESESFISVGNVNNVLISGGHIIGNSTGVGGKHAIYFTNGDNIQLENIEIEESSQHGIKFGGCTNSRIQNCNLHNNYRYGIESIDGVNNLFIQNRLNDNGYVDAGVTYIAGGRGITVWKEKHSTIMLNEASENSEYGIRIYSETADSVYSENNRIIYNYLKDNGDDVSPTKIDIYLYSEGSLDKLKNTLVAFNSIERTRTGKMIDLSGVYTNAIGNTLEDVNAGLNCQGIFNFGVQDGIIKDNVLKNVLTAFGTSGSVIPNRCEYTGNIVDGCVEFIGDMYGDNHKIEGNRAVHAGAGTTDVAINHLGNDCIIKNNVLDGFYRCIVIDNSPLTIIGNRTVNTTGNGMYKNGDLMEGLVLMDNDFDTCFPGELQGMTSYKNSRQRRVTHYNVAPINLTWDVGDIAFHRDPVAGGFVGWVCTTAGTPGTWKTFGNITA